MCACGQCVCVCVHGLPAPRAHTGFSFGVFAHKTPPPGANALDSRNPTFAGEEAHKRDVDILSFRVIKVKRNHGLSSAPVCEALYLVTASEASAEVSSARSAGEAAPTAAQTFTLQRGGDEDAPPGPTRTRPNAAKPLCDESVKIKSGWRRRVCSAPTKTFRRMHCLLWTHEYCIGLRCSANATDRFVSHNI